MKRSRSQAQLSTKARPALKRQRRMVMYRPVQTPAALYRRGTEVKTVDVKVTNQVINSTGSIALLNGIAEGTSFNNRVGRRVSLKSLQISGTLDDNTGGTPINDSLYVRMLVLYDRQNNGGTPALADILQDVDSAGTTTTDAYSGINMNNSDRFKVLMDNRVFIPNDQTSAAGTNLEQGIAGYLPSTGETNIKRFIKLGGLETHYGTANANVAGCQTGAIWLVFVAAGSNMLQANLRIRLRYFDQ